MRLLTVDLETSPNVADVWGLWQQNVGLNQLRESTQVISFAAKWYGEKKVEFRSVHHDGREAMIQRAWDLLDEADALIHWNGTSFDTKHLKREFVEAGLTPPSPFKEIDLMLAVKKNFRFPSNKLQYVSTALGLKGKLSHTGHDLWVKCMAGDDKAWNLMRRYNIQDVRLTEELYDRLKPWLTSHPHVGLYDETVGDSCNKCGGTDLKRRGFAYTPLGKFAQFRCEDCGGWSRSKKNLASIDARGA